MSPLFEQPENDLPLPSRRAMADESSRTREMENAHPPEREVTLNTGVVLALFFALALLCAVFFGFGYSMGRKSVPPPAIAESDAPAVTATEDPASGKAKPTSGAAANAPVPSYVGPSGTAPSTEVKRTDAKPTPSTAMPAETGSAQDAPAPRPRSSPPAGATAASAAPSAPIVRVNPVPSPPAASGTSGTVYVQVSAVSHQEDANVLLSALRRRGYTVFTRSDPNDSLIHVQLGPFATKKDADAMRQRLSGDGYNAILK